MSAPQRIQRKRTRGWRMPEGAIYVGRPTRWGNPFIVGGRITAHADDTEAGFTVDMDAMTAEQAVAAYRDLMHIRTHLYDDEVEPSVAEWQRAVSGLKGHDLACWCALDQPCHADVLLELANGGAR